MKKILISIPTFRRKEGLKNTLNGLENLVIPKDVKIEVLVVENDSKKTVEKIVSSFKRFPIHYVLEKNQGLVFVRNRILLEAKDLKVDYLAGIDDDEVATSNWLVSLWNEIQKSKATVVTGPTISQFEKTPPSWITKGHFFVTENKRETGKHMTHAGAGNYLVDLSFVFKNNLRFDSRFNFVGAEDTDFFETLTQMGGKIVWVAEAFVLETVPQARMTLKYLLKREYRIGIGRAVRFKKKSFLLGLGLSFFALIKIILYTSLLPMKTTRANFFKQLCKIVKQIGLSVGFFKGTIHAYGKK